MSNATAANFETVIDLTAPWDVPARLIEALAAFDQLVTQIDGAVLGGLPVDTPLDLTENRSHTADESSKR